MAQRQMRCVAVQSLLLMMCVMDHWRTTEPVPLAPSSDGHSSEARRCMDEENLACTAPLPMMLQTMEGAFLSVTWGAKAAGLSVDESCCPPDTHFVLKDWRGLHVLMSVPLGLMLGVRAGEPVWGQLPGGGSSAEDESLHEDEVVDVVEDLVASRTVSLRFGRDASQLMRFPRDGASVQTGTVAAAGLDSVLVVVDDQLRRNLESLNTEGYAVVQVLGKEEVESTTALVPCSSISWQMHASCTACSLAGT